jgi:hypothetical protein
MRPSFRARPPPLDPRAWATGPPAAVGRGSPRSSEDRRPGQAQRDERGRFEDRAVVESHLTQALDLALRGRVRVVHDLTGPGGERPLPLGQLGGQGACDDLRGGLVVAELRETRAPGERAVRVPALRSACGHQDGPVPVGERRRGHQVRSLRHERFIEIRAPRPKARQVPDVAVRLPIRLVGLSGRLARRRFAEKCRLLGHPGSIQTMGGRVHW